MSKKKQNPQRAVVTARDLNVNGQGVATLPEGLAVFVDGLLPGEKAEVELTERRPRYARARLLRLLEASPDRVTPRCPVADECGGCTLQDLSYEAQLRWKWAHVRDTLLRIGGIPAEQLDACMRPILGMEEPWAYRAKVQIPCSGSSARPLLGFYRGQSHEIVDSSTCDIQPELCDRLREDLRRFLQGQTLFTPYNEATHSGLIRHLWIRVGFGTRQVMVALVLNQQGPVKEQKDALAPLLAKWKKSCESLDYRLESVLLNFQPEKTNVILGRNSEVLYGSDTIRETLGGLTYTLGVQAFFQVNPSQTEKLYTEVVELAALRGDEEAWDLYCGTGSISLWLARRARSVLGIEVVEQAVVNARENAKANGLGERCTFLCGEAEVLGPELCREGRRPEVVVVDPPRKGCGEPLLRALLEMAPPRLVYVSCNPATLARDLKLLMAGGYRLEVVRPVDLFPHTTHVETVVRLGR